MNGNFHLGPKMLDDVWTDNGFGFCHDGRGAQDTKINRDTWTHVTHEILRCDWSWSLHSTFLFHSLDYCHICTHLITLLFL